MTNTQNTSTRKTLNVASRITTVALTGGPCAGKTTLMEKLANEIDNIPKVKVFFAKEAATLLQQSGINYIDAGADETFQKLIIEHQLTAEKSARVCAMKFAKKHPEHKVIIICDRGIMDGAAYFDTAAEFDKILSKYRLNKQKVYERYDMVLFLRSAAVGAEQFYTTMDGTPRVETPKQAVQRDKGVYDAWCEHHNFKALENTFKFYEKLDVAVQLILAAAGIQVPNKFFKRFVIKCPNFFDTVAMVKMNVCDEQFYFLQSEAKGQVVFLKSQRKASAVRYQKSENRFGMVKNSKNKKVYTCVFQQDSTITENEFANQLAKLDPLVNHLVRKLYSFTISFSVRCELELYPYSDKYAIIKVYMDSPADEKKVKEKFEVCKEITDDPRYSEYEIAKRLYNAFEEFN